MPGLTDTCVLQLCHGYDGPFLDCARQYSVLFKETHYRVVTIFLTGPPDESVERGCASDEVLFLNYRSRDLRGLKLAAIRELKQIVRRYNTSFIIAHRFKPTYIALLATELPVIAVNHAFGVYARLSRRLLANFYRRRLCLLGISEAVTDDLRASLRGWPTERIETLYNRIDIEAVQSEQLDRDAARTVLGLPVNAWVVGNAGRLHPDKDQATLLRGFAKALPNLPEGSLLVVMGSGQMKSALHSLASDLGISSNVCFLGQVPHGRRYFKAFDLFALTSDHEPFGMVLLEAMSAGVPVICTDCGGGREVVSDLGGLFPLRDHNALSRLLVDYAEKYIHPSKYLQEKMNERLKEKFSDEAASDIFWALPAITKLSCSVTGE